MDIKKIMVMAAVVCMPLLTQAQEEKVNYVPKLNGTVRAKYEWQTEEGEGRFQVRNARLSVTGNVHKAVEYKAEIELCDEGTIKMLDAYTRLKAIKGLDFTIGQFRCPFTIDAHRSPHQQYFANRSFIAKQVGNVRDVGASIGYTIDAGFPIIIQAGIFNGSGLTDQKNFWTKSINYSAKAQFFIPGGFNVTLSAQKTRPELYTVMMYDAGAYYQAYGWHIEAEYLYKTYSHDSFDDVHAFNSFISYDIPLKKCFFSKLTPLVRYDYMTDHWDGEDAVLNDAGKYVGEITDSKRGRLTAGVTLSIAKPFVSDIRLNFEKYFYDDDATIKTSEKDKIVIEFMTRF